MVLTSNEHIKPGTRLRKVAGSLYLNDILTYVNDTTISDIIRVRHEDSGREETFYRYKFERVDGIPVPEVFIDDNEIKVIWY